MRLIDADELVKDMASILSECKDPKIMGKVIETIEAQPVAFDMENVFAKLKDQYNYSHKVRNQKNNIYFEYWDGRMDSYKDAIEIFKKDCIDEMFGDET